MLRRVGTAWAASQAPRPAAEGAGPLRTHPLRPAPAPGGAGGGGGDARVTRTEVYGFTGMVTVAALWAVYLAWAYAPAAAVAALPARYWALAGPAWLACLVAFLYAGYESWCMSRALPPDSPRTLHDAASRWAENVPAARRRGAAVPALVDVPLTRVNRLLYD